MLWTIFVVLLILALLGFINVYSIGNFVYLILLAAESRVVSRRLADDGPGICGIMQAAAALGGLRSHLSVRGEPLLSEWNRLGSARDDGR